MRPIAYAAVVAALLGPTGAWPDAADPAAPVPPMPYRSVFQDTPTFAEEGLDDWKKANAEVGRFTRGHIDLLKWEETQGGTARPPSAPPAAAPRPGATPAPAAPGTHPPGHQH